MKHISIFFFAIIIAVYSLSAGGGSETESSTIGISKIVAHPALDAVEQGIKDELTEMGWDLFYDVQNANGDVNAAATIAQKFKADKVRLAVGIATPTAQALVQALTDIPVIYTAVTDPVAAGIVGSYDEGEEYVTGVSDRTPVREQLELLLAIDPSIRTIGHVYTSSEDNAVFLADLAREATEDLGRSFVESTVTNSSEVRAAFLSIANRIDALYVSTDNTVVSALPALTSVAEDHAIPIMSADPSSSVEIGGVLAAWGFDYYKMGRFTGTLIHSILEGEKMLSEIPTQFMTNPNDVELFIDLDVASRLRLTVSEDILSQAASVREGEMLR